MRPIVPRIRTLLEFHEDDGVRALECLARTFEYSFLVSLDIILRRPT